MPAWAHRASHLREQHRLWGTSQGLQNSLPKRQCARLHGETAEVHTVALATGCACDVMSKWTGRYQAMQASASCRMLWRSRARHRLLLSRCPSPRPSLSMHLALGRAASRAVAAAGKEPVITLWPGPVRYLGLGCTVRKRKRNFPNTCQAAGQQTKQLWHNCVLGRPRLAPPGFCSALREGSGDELGPPGKVRDKPILLKLAQQGLARPLLGGLSLLHCICRAAVALQLAMASVCFIWSPLPAPMWQDAETC